VQPKILRYGIAAAVLALAAACSKQEAPKAAVAEKPAPPPPVRVDVVPEKSRSAHFLAVSKHLDLGGTLYGYVDVDGDVMKVAGGLQGVLQQLAKAQPQVAPFASQNYTEIFKELGLNDIKAVGVSSMPDGTGYFQNKTFFYSPGERHGLMASLGGKAAPFALVGLAPADADVYAETELDLAVVYKTVKAVVGKVAGEPASGQMEEALKKAGQGAALSILDLIYGLKGHAAFVMKLDPEKTFSFPPGSQGVSVPKFSFLLAVEGVAAPVESSLKETPFFKASEADGLRLYEFAQPSPIDGLTILIAAKGSTLYLATSKEFLTQCLTQKSGLAETAAFREALSHVGTEGNGLGYVSPRFFSTLRKLETLNPNLPADAKSSIQYALQSLPSPDRPLVSVRTNLPDGILVRSYWNRSLKADVAMVAVYNPVTIGILAAMAIPAFEKVRTSSQEKAIINNLRQLEAAADMYYLENGKASATYTDLVGPTRYIKVLQPVMGEDYRKLRFVQGEPLIVRLPNGRTIQYPPEGQR
jgi:type IV pilus assembly protein PilA